MKEWKKYKIGDVFAYLKSGKGIHANEISSKGEYPVYGGNGVRGYTTRNNFEGNCAIIGRQGAFCGNVRYFKRKAYMTEHAIIAVAKDKSELNRRINEQESIRLTILRDTLLPKLMSGELKINATEVL